MFSIEILELWSFLYQRVTYLDKIQITAIISYSRLTMNDRLHLYRKKNLFSYILNFEKKNECQCIKYTDQRSDLTIKIFYKNVQIFINDAILNLFYGLHWRLSGYTF